MPTLPSFYLMPPRTNKIDQFVLCPISSMPASNHLECNFNPLLTRASSISCMPLITSDWNKLHVKKEACLSQRPQKTPQQNHQRRTNEMCLPTDITNFKPTQQDWMVVMEALAGRTAPKRRVRFSSAVTNVRNSTPAEELRQLWYNQEELTAFRAEAKQLARAGVKVRGLEHCAPERQKHRKLSIKCTLSAYRRGMDERNVSVVAQRCSEWNTEIAFVQACHDYCDIYQPAMKAVVPEISSIPARFPYATKKREATPPACIFEADRRVRRRTMVGAIVA